MGHHTHHYTAEIVVGDHDLVHYGLMVLHRLTLPLVSLLDRGQMSNEDGHDSFTLDYWMILQVCEL